MSLVHLAVVQDGLGLAEVKPEWRCCWLYHWKNG